jgi:uncharacterized Zn-binding protein involved in type VI secretion
MPAPVTCVGDPTDPEFLEVGTLGPVLTGATTVMAEGRPVATAGSFVGPHGNPVNPKAPGYNPICAESALFPGVATVLVEGRPIATLTTSICNCMLHTVTYIGAPTVIVGP